MNITSTGLPYLNSNRKRSNWYGLLYALIFVKYNNLAAFNFIYFELMLTTHTFQTVTLRSTLVCDFATLCYWLQFGVESHDLFIRILRGCDLGTALSSVMELNSTTQQHLFWYLYGYPMKFESPIDTNVTVLTGPTIRQMGLQIKRQWGNRNP